jgi:hypothetical protein
MTPSIDEMLMRDLETWQPDEDVYELGDPLELDLLKWSRLVKKAASLIDPQTAEVTCFYEEEGDPYGLFRSHMPNGPGVMMFYARSPENEMQKLSRYKKFALDWSSRFGPWVWFGDLPEPVRNALWEKHKKKLLGD